MTGLVLKPRLSEKAYALSEANRTYVFIVPKTANSSQIATAVASQYDVKVNSVRLASVAASPRRSYRKRGRFIKTTKPSTKKAYVTLKDGEVLPLFAKDDEKNAKDSK